MDTKQTTTTRVTCLHFFFLNSFYAIKHSFFFVSFIDQVAFISKQYKHATMHGKALWAISELMMSAINHLLFVCVRTYVWEICPFLRVKSGKRWSIISVCYVYVCMYTYLSDTDLKSFSLSYYFGMTLTLFDWLIKWTFFF